ncbi:hypothetical protein [Prosthecobacter sp.]|uniref:hypothetical protein n=1 Tax=Prosthecobacter sp. TaxID=1965333 RepID=UPI0037848FEB
MNDGTLFNTLLQQFGFAGLLVVAVYLIARKLAHQYEARISALETASSRCEADRVELRRIIIDLQTGVIKDLTAKLIQGDAE